MPETGALPLVSVVVPVYNGAATIAACVESLLALDYPPDRLEITVVDNRSTDATAAILARYPVRTVTEGTIASSYAARNRGILSSRGDILAFTDADCVVDPGWLRGLTRALAPRDVGGTAGVIRPYRAASAIERFQARHALRAEHAFNHPFLPFAQTANAGYKREVFERIGLFDPTIVFGGDLDLSWRMQRTSELRLAFAEGAVVWHQHRTTARGLFKLYEKNAIANCLLAGRYDHYAHYPRMRTFLYLVRETMRSMLRVPAGAWGAGQAGTALVEATRFAGEAWGWLRWRSGRRWHGRVSDGPPRLVPRVSAHTRPSVGSAAS